jgi:hypothetical protein
MTESISAERLAKIRSVLDALGTVPPGAVRALLAEVDRLRAAVEQATEWQCRACGRWVADDPEDVPDPVELWCTECGHIGPRAEAERRIISGAEVERLREQVRHVRDLHSAEPGSDTCYACDNDWLVGQCPTIRVLDAEARS